MVVTMGQQYNVGEKPTVIMYTYINRHAGPTSGSSILSVAPVGRQGKACFVLQGDSVQGGHNEWILRYPGIACSGNPGMVPSFPLVTLRYFFIPTQTFPRFIVSLPLPCFTFSCKGSRVTKMLENGLFPFFALPQCIPGDGILAAPGLPLKFYFASPIYNSSVYMQFDIAVSDTASLPRVCRYGAYTDEYPSGAYICERTGSS